MIPLLMMFILGEPEWETDLRSFIGAMLTRNLTFQRWLIHIPIEFTLMR